MEGTFIRVSSEHNDLQPATHPLRLQGLRSDSGDSKSFLKKSLTLEGFINIIF